MHIGRDRKEEEAEMLQGDEFITRLVEKKEEDGDFFFLVFSVNGRIVSLAFFFNYVCTQ